MCGPATPADECDRPGNYGPMPSSEPTKYSINDLVVRAYLAMLTGAMADPQTVKVDYEKLAVEAYGAATALWAQLPDKCRGY